MEKMRGSKKIFRVSVLSLSVLVLGGTSVADQKPFNPVSITTGRMTVTGKGASAQFHPVAIQTGRMTVTGKGASIPFTPVAITTGTLTVTGKKP